MDIGNIFEEWDFSGTVPLPYRVLLMGCIGIFAWASNLHLLAHLRVDVPALLFSHPPLPGHHIRHHHLRQPPRSQARDSASTPSSATTNNSNSNNSTSSKYASSIPTSLIMLYRATYMLGAAFLIMTLFNMSMYKWVLGEPSSAPSKPSANATTTTTTTTRGGIGRDGNPRAGIFVPIFGYMTILAMLFIPYNILFIKERYRFLRSMKKVCFSGFNTSVTFSDVILADILTSFARVLGDLAVALCLMFWGGKHDSVEGCYNSMLVPIMTSIPYFIRLRQCLTEYKDSNYKVRRHLMNALKYASAFPVIVISNTQKSVKAAALQGAPNPSMFSDNALFRLWLFFVALNSFYSFYWDIKHDWMLIERVPGGGSSGGYNFLSGSPPVYKESAASGAHHMGTSTATSGLMAMTPTSKASSSMMPSSPKITSHPINSTTTNSNSNAHLSTQGGLMNPFTSSTHHHHHYAGSNKRGNFTAPSTTATTTTSLYLRSPRTWWPWFRQRSGLSSFRMRHYLHYEESYFYLFAIVLDFLLRTTWMMKVFGNIQIEEYEGGVFTMECLEVLRRWVWVLFRLEAEMVKRQAPASPLSSPSLLPNPGPFFVGAGSSNAADSLDNDDDESIPLTLTHQTSSSSSTSSSTTLATTTTTTTTVISPAIVSANGELSLDAKMEKGSNMAMADLKGDR